MLTEFQKRALTLASNLWRQMQERLNTPRGEVIGEEAYWYGHPLLTVAATSSGQTNITIQSDADFDIYYLSCTSISGGALQNSPYATWQITDTGTGRQFFSEPLLITLSAGISGTPYILQNVKTMVAKSNLQITYNNLSAGSLDFQCALGGIKVFYKK